MEAKTTGKSTFGTQREYILKGFLKKEYGASSGKSKAPAILKLNGFQSCNPFGGNHKNAQCMALLKKKKKI